MEIKPVERANYEAIAGIYAEGIATGLATFETDVPDWKKWNESHLESCRIAGFKDGTIIGWASLAPVSGRCVYAGVAEVSIYIGKPYRLQGYGERLLEKLIAESEKANVWTLQAGIFQDNMASIKLHGKCGFRMVGYREKIGKLNGVWKNTVLMERRSQNVGL
jgi:phosphinothricin acetyltransferase